MMNLKDIEEMRNRVLKTGRQAVANEIKKHHLANRPVCFSVNGTIVWQLPNGEITMKEPK